MPWHADTRIPPKSPESASLNRRGRRLAVTVAATAAVVLLVLAIAHWRTVCDHIEAWRFQLTRETETIEPDPAAVKRTIKDLPVFDGDNRGFFASVEHLLPLLGSSEMPVIFEQGPKATGVVWDTGSPTLLRPVDLTASTSDVARRILASNGFRVLEQRFPRKAYVVIHDQGATP